MTESSITAIPFTATHQAALDLDLSVLDQLLRRNRSSHGRTKYHQRCAMLVRAVVRHLQQFDGDDNTTIPLLTAMSRWQENMQSFLRQQARRRKMQDVLWTTVQPHTTDDDDETMRRQAFAQQLHALHHAISVGVPEIISRSHYAAQALFLELSRGFFVPLCSVAVAAVARVRALVVRLARHALPLLSQLHALYLKLLQQQQGSRSKAEPATLLWNDDSFVAVHNVLGQDAAAAAAAASATTSEQSNDATMEVLLDSMGLSSSAHPPSIFTKRATEPPHKSEWADGRDLANEPSAAAAVAATPGSDNDDNNSNDDVKISAVATVDRDTLLEFAKVSAVVDIGEGVLAEYGNHDDDEENDENDHQATLVQHYQNRGKGKARKQKKRPRGNKEAADSGGGKDGRGRDQRKKHKGNFLDQLFS